ncbi:TonB-linked outer membrane protein, SusC/RagA family [Parapedobacter koreensis]|uniref:TonB-linked outer membrane protein, SusC/RagA family n=2 Tax=Parapedobacter koreensis TaxID=332977 RepID=A0A1H7Q7S0_9SPHI|nr:TonB-linked outer membrane protein, SusC/RagA family [Parapedobacter koreensis]
MYEIFTAHYLHLRNCVKPKYLLVMKLSCILLLISCLQVSAFTYAQRVTLQKQQATLVEVFKDIKKQTGYHIFYDTWTIRNTKPISINVKEATIEEVLSESLKGQGLGYKLVAQNIIITSGSINLPMREGENRQEITITGKVTDEQGRPLEGVTVIVKGGTRAVTTDPEGNYRIQLPNRSEVLVFSIIGYAPVEISASAGNTINVTLKEQVSGLDEVVVVGYGTQRIATVTGSVATVKGETLTKAPAINLSNAMVGRLPGLVAVTRSGEPGGDGSTFRIRGANTLGDNSPLIVVDGVANRPLERLNATDIESVTILKDASAAIYGAQAANGVILVTTRRGKQGKPQISFSYNEGWSMPTVIPNTADAATYLQMLNEISMYAGQPAKYSEEEIQHFRNGDDPWLYPNTNWYDATFKDAAAQRTANLTISGGQENLTYFISAGTNYQDAIYKNSATNYKQMNFRINLDGKMSDYVKYSVNVAGREENRNYPTRSASDIFVMLRRGKPNMPAYWPNGMNGPDIEYGNNPVVVTTNQTGYDRNKATMLESKATLDISIPGVKGLTLTGSAAYDRRLNNDKLWRTPWYLYAWDGVSRDDNGEPILVEGQKGYTNPELTQEMSDGDLLTLNTLLNYQLNLQDKHHIKALFGVERISGESMNFNAYRKNFVSTALDQLFAGGDAEKNNGGSASLQARLNYFGRVNYDFSNKYLFEFVWRYDGSYIFPEAKRFGFFPGVSLGWRVSDETFWQPLKPVVSDFKIRGSWGQTGNDRIGTYQYLASYGFASAANQIYVFNGNVESKILSELRIPNPNVTWEVANQSNVGFDVGLFNNTVTLSAEYFHNVRTDILWRRNASVPQSSGFTLPSENIGEVTNQGAEFQLGYQNSLGQFQYSLSANINFNKNRIQFWDETPGSPDYQQSTGHPMNTNLYYKAIGIFRDQAAVDAYPHWTNARPGDVIFEDVNNDGEINALDRIRIYETDLPTQTGGLNIDLSYKGFYTSLFFQWATGAVRNNYYEHQGETGNFLTQDVEGRWTPDNLDANKPRAWNRYSEYWRNNQNTYWLQNSDYIRLKTVDFGYQIPAAICKKMRMSSAQVYFSGLNLLTFTDVKDFDPETTSATAYPLNKVYNLGVTLTF